MKLLVREYWPAFVEREDEPREQVIESITEIFDIPWIKEKGGVEIKDHHFVMHGNYVVATIRESR